MLCLHDARFRVALEVVGDRATGDASTKVENLKLVGHARTQMNSTVTPAESKALSVQEILIATNVELTGHHVHQRPTMRPPCVCS